MIEKFNNIINNLINESKEYENNLEYQFKRNSGSYYTGYTLARKMVKELFDSILLDSNYDVLSKKILEPCVGSGIFIYAIIEELINRNYKRKNIIKVIQNIYVSDINKDILKIYNDNIKKICKTVLNYELEPEYSSTHTLDYLVYNTTELNSKYRSLTEYLDFKFDIIITNPPYKNLKLDSKKYNSQMSEEYKEYYIKISQESKKQFKYAASGIINIYKLFVEEIICNYSTDNAYISLLLANTILTDKSCESLREMMLKNHNIISIYKINEVNNFIDAQQSLCSMLIKKGEPTNKIKIIDDNTDKPFLIKISTLEKLQNGNAIFPLSEYESNILKSLTKFPKLKELNFIKNLRGELDVTLGKKFISTNNNGYPLLRGRHINEYFIKDDINEFINREFEDNSTKSMYIKQDRIACQQISNMNQQKRINFAYIPPKYVLGNSCNFISIEPNIFGIDIFYILGLLNSKIIDWYFNFFNSNNHISNYEINEFPIPTEGKEIAIISTLVKNYLKTKDITIKEKINSLVNDLYGIEEKVIKAKSKDKNIIKSLFNDIKHIIPNITTQNCEEILSKKTSLQSLLLNLNTELDKFNTEVALGIIDKYKKINNNEILNHTTFKLSDLDLEMIKDIPQGGNWQCIPEQTIKKSQRLTKISKTGGRTTLYGRIDYSKPSYTITTYFNRPGNGTYVHPIHNRVISVREAARLQSFDDTYYFYGNKTSLLKQVGNAVPVLLGKAIGERIVEITGCNRSLDLFCGAGGLTSGFTKAGIKSIMGTDFDKSACITFKINNPDSNILCDDITLDKTKNEIYKYIENNSIDIICGGPPCQGFSLAGKRFIDDPRNQLFKDYIEVVKNVKPKIVIMENVEGLLTFQNGEIYNQIIDLYHEMNYKVEGRPLLANEYGVPQKRKRVIIIAVRNDLKFNPSDLFPIKTTENLEDQITAENALKDLENINCCDLAKYDSSYNSKYTNYLLNNYINSQ